MKEKIDYYNENGSAKKQAEVKAKRANTWLCAIVVKKLWSHVLSVFSLWLPISNLRVTLQRLRGVKIGKHVFIGGNVSIDNAYPDYVILEDDCAINANVTIMAHSNPKQHFEGILDAYLEKVVIKKGAWIAIGAIILPGVTIGEYSVISAGSVVSLSVPPYSIVRGNPAKVVTSYPPELLNLESNINKLKLIQEK